MQTYRWVRGSFMFVEHFFTSLRKCSPQLCHRRLGASQQRNLCVISTTIINLQERCKIVETIIDYHQLSYRLNGLQVRFTSFAPDFNAARSKHYTISSLLTKPFHYMSPLTTPFQYFVIISETIPLLRHKGMIFHHQPPHYCVSIDETVSLLRHY